MRKPHSPKFSRGRAASNGKAKTESLTGIIDVTRRGVGYFTVQGLDRDIEIAPEQLHRALNGDTVRIETIGKRYGRSQGKVVEILERAKEKFVGTVRREEGKTLLYPDDRRMYTPIEIHSTEKLESDFKVAVKIVGWNEGEYPVGELLEKFGKKGEHEAEIAAIIFEQGFEAGFPARVEEEAEKIGRERDQLMEEKTKGRRDFRTTTTFTIDPVDAKDFDDALSVKELGNGDIEVGIHIADVSAFLPLGSATDAEAQKRGTSIYLVDRTVPMLPEVLSNDLCSLNEDVDRLTFSAVFVLSPEAEIKERWFGETVIHSHKRFSYEEAQKVLDEGAGPHVKELTILETLGKKLREGRFKEGAIEFDQEEIKFTLDEKGRPIGIRKKVRLETNLLIEDFMLLANREVAEYVYNLGKKLPEARRTFVYRIHDVPKAEKLEELGTFLRAIGYELNTNKNVTAKDINRLFDQLDGKPEENLIKTATIRSMAKAVYATKNIGHFGLSFRYYTHFTSPIRRYPDVMVHRILKGHLKGNPLSAQELQLYERLSIQSSEREVAAAEAERDSIKMKQVEYMSSKIGQEFDALVSGIAEWGMYVSENESKAEGLIRLKDINDDYYVADTANYRIVGEKKKRTFRLGDPIRVKLTGANLDERTLDFALA